MCIKDESLAPPLALLPMALHHGLCGKQESAWSSDLQAYAEGERTSGSAQQETSSMRHRVPKRVATVCILLFILFLSSKCNLFYMHITA